MNKYIYTLMSTMCLSTLALQTITPVFANPQTQKTTINHKRVAADTPTEGTSGTVKWKLEGNTLHLSAGTLGGAYHSGDKVSAYYSVWNGLKDKITNISFDGDVYTPVDATGLFSQLTSLKTLTNANNLHLDKSNQLAGLFYGDGALESVDTTGWNAKSATNVSYMFHLCSSIQTVDLNFLNPSIINNYEYMFHGDLALNKIDVSKLLPKGNKTTTIASMFYNCVSLTDLNISNWDTSTVTDTNETFMYMSNITKLDVSKWDLNQDYNAANMFNGNGALNDLGSTDAGLTWGLENLHYAGSMFKDCVKLENINTSAWNLGVLRDASHMFDDTNVKTIDGSNWGMNSIQNTSYIFNNTRNLESVDMSGWHPNTYDGSMVWTDASWMFNYSGLKNIKFPNTLDTSKLTKINRMFSNDLNLSQLDLTSWTIGENVHTDDFVANDSHLTAIQMPKVAKSHIELNTYYGPDSEWEIANNGYLDKRKQTELNDGALYVLVTPKKFLNAPDLNFGTHKIDDNLNDLSGEVINNTTKDPLISTNIYSDDVNSYITVNYGMLTDSKNTIDSNLSLSLDNLKSSKETVNGNDITLFSNSSQILTDTFTRTGSYSGNIKQAKLTLNNPQYTGDYKANLTYTITNAPK